jgi:hypothetical protein
MHLDSIGDIDTINWTLDDGVNLSMINDLARNQFYDAVLSQDLRGLDAVEIGFGTGLLTMLALKHGARHVVAYESDAHRWRLGTKIISDLHLDHKIELRWDRFNYSDILEFPSRIFFTETVNGNLFQEGLWNSIPRHPNVDFRPSNYRLDIHSIEIPTHTAALMDTVTDKSWFNPGVVTWPGFEQTVNRYRGSLESHDTGLALASGINQFNHQVETVWGWLPYLRLTRIQPATAGYSIDTYNATMSIWSHDHKSDRPIDHDADTIVIDIQVCAQDDRCVLLIPRASMGYRGYHLSLDQSHWGPMDRPVIINDFTGVVRVKHNVNTGYVDYSLV